ncbi:Cullin repeat-like-containing domain protein [Chlamydoabsidia padenii]|nr:Cullin repeat-like-containing domain protein [Chlamydoabsidia padenii]
MPMASGPITIDLHRFASDNLQPQEVVKQLLGNASEEDIRGFHKSLMEAKHTVGGDLQRNVYRNYTQFVSLSKEIANLDGGVTHLKMYLNDVRGIWQGFLTMADQVDEGNMNEDTEIVISTRKPSDLMSTDLQAVYRSQLTALWENVEGSQKFVKYAPGRHIIREFANFTEMDPASGQPRQHVHIFLLNDCLLVATRKNRSMSTRYKLVAMYCWNVHDMRMVERTQSDGNKTYAYRSGRPEENIALFHSFTRLLDDDKINDAGNPLNELRQGQTKDIRLDEEDRLWLEQLPDELEVMIALRQFEDAVTCIGKDQVAKYTDTLSATICSDLGNPLLTKLQFQRYVDWLLRLDKGEKAREVFLATRSLIIKKRIRQLIFEGDTTTYINELALVVYTLIRNTCEWYRDSFKQNAMSSGFVTWVREQTEIYAEIYKRQVFYQHQLSCQVISDCFKSTLDQCSMLRKVGLDLKFLLEDLFMENTKETVVAYEKKIGIKIDKFVHNDNFTTVSSQSLGPDCISLNRTLSSIDVE